MKYTKRKWKVWCQRPTMGGRWIYGNYGLGVMIDSHPRFFNLMLCLLFVDIGIGWTRDAIIDDARVDDHTYFHNCKAYSTDDGGIRSGI